MRQLARLILGLLPASALSLTSAQAGYAQSSGKGYEPPWHHDGQAHYEKKEERFGRFTVVRNIEDYRDVPMLDSGPWLTEQSILTWHDSMGEVDASFIDSGSSVRFEANYKATTTGVGCSIQGPMVGYDPKPSTIENWRKLQPFVRQQLRYCNPIPPANMRRIIGELQASDTDYVAAANAWKAVSVEIFGSGRKRCVRERLLKPIVISPHYECTEYSKP